MAGTSGLAPGVAPTFVGRQRELDQLLNWARESAAGQPRLVLVQGDAGVGKSRLVDEFLQRASSNATVLLARCQEDVSVPYLPLANALKDVVPFGSLAARTEDPEHTLGDGRLELFLSVTSALLDHAAQRPVLLVVDDFHWAESRVGRARPPHRRDGLDGGHPPRSLVLGGAPPSAGDRGRARAAGPCSSRAGT